MGLIQRRRTTNSSQSKISLNSIPSLVISFSSFCSKSLPGNPKPKTHPFPAKSPNTPPQNPNSKNQIHKFPPSQAKPSQTHFQSRHESTVSEAQGGPQGRLLQQWPWRRLLLLRGVGPASTSPRHCLLFRSFYLHPRPSSSVKRSQDPPPPPRRRHRHRH